MSGGGGGGGNETQTQVVDLPDWAKPYAKEGLGQAAALTDINKNPYQAYGGNRQADFTGLQTKAFTGAENMAPSAAMGTAAQMAGQAGLGALNTQYSPYQTGQFTGQTAQDYMSPYMQNVVDIQKREAQRSADIAGTQRAGQATRAGAFGGARQAIMEAEAGRNLQQQLGDIQATGQQAAYQDAASRFAQEQQMREQSRQYGAGLGMQGLQTALTGAGQLANIGQQTFGQEMDINKLQQQYGTQQQAFKQQGLDTAYQDFLNQQRYPYQQLEFMNSMLRGTPMGTVQSMYQPTPSPISQLAGAAGSIYAGSKLMADGGSVNYASGGIAGLNPMELDAATDKMSDSQMQQSMGIANIADLAKLQIAQKLAQNGQIRQAAQRTQAAQQEQPQTSVAEEALAELGIGGLDVPEEMFSAADGGIVAFAEGSGKSGVPGGTLASRNPVTMRMLAPVQAEVEQARKMYEAAAKSQDKESMQFYLKQLSDAQTKLDSLAKEQFAGSANEAIGAAQAQMMDQQAAPSAAPSATASSAPPRPMSPSGEPLRKIEERAGISDGSTPPQGGAQVVPPPSKTGIASGLNDPALNRSMEDIVGLMKPKDYDQKVAEYMANQQAINAQSVSAAEARRKRFEDDTASLGIRGEKQEAYINEELSKLDSDKDRSFWMGVLKGSLTAMGGKDPNPFANISQGAIVGVDEVAKSQKDLQKRRDDLRKNLFSLEEARYGDKQLSQKERRDLDAKVDESLIQVQQANNDLAKQYGIDVPAANAKAAATIFLNQERERIKAKLELDKAKISAPQQDKILQIADRMIAAGDKRPFAEVVKEAAKVAAAGTITAAEIRKPTDPLEGLMGVSEAPPAGAVRLKSPK